MSLRPSTSCSRRAAWLALFALTALIGVASACLITNCPRGGKRGGAAAALQALHRPREAREVRCASCGPAGDGYCVGPGICCSPLFGCVLAAQGSCSRAMDAAGAAAFPPRCTPPTLASTRRGPPIDAPCGADLTPDGSAPGRCAAQGVCCTHDSCRLDAICLSREDSDLAVPGYDADMMSSMMHRLNGESSNSIS